jgi:hypothetical protein
MAGNFRLSFKDIDTSQGLGTTDSTVQGYMVIKAPKGNAMATYFPKGSANKIISLVGVPSIQYPNIQDALDFNASYGLYLSSPASSSEEYPSYYGGFYVTERGLYDFDRVTDITAPNYHGRLTVASKTRPLVSESDNGLITLTAPDAWTYARLYGIRLTYTGNNLASEDLKGKVVDLVKDGDDFVLTVGASNYPVGLGDSEDLTVVMGGDAADAPDYVLWGDGGALATYNYFDEYFLTGGITVEWIIDLSNDTYYYINQRSPNETPTNVTISKIGYVRSVTNCIANILTSYNHSLSNKNAIKFSSVGSLSGIDVGTTYYVRDVDSNHLNDFGLATTPNGSRITITGTVGSGVIYTEVTWPTNQISFSLSEEGAPGRQVGGGTYIGNLVTTSLDSYGANNYIENLLTDEMNAFAQIRVVKPFTSPVTTMIAPQTVSMTGQRYASLSTADLSVVLAEGWTEALNDEYDTISLFMEPSGDDTTKSSLAAVRSIHQLSTVIAPLVGASVEDLHDALAAAPRSKGMAYYANQFFIKEAYAGTTFWSNCIGAIGTKLAAIMEGRFGGWPPMFIDYNGLGGSLPVSAIKQKIKFSNENQQLMDQLGINIIVQDPFHGPLILGQKTSIASTEITDWSYLAHSMAFDIFKREIRDLVMIPQLGKPIDTQFQNIRQFQAQGILNKRTLGPGKIWESGLVDAFTGNDATAKAARTFKLIIQVKVTVFSEFVELTLENVGQNVTL